MKRMVTTAVVGTLLFGSLTLGGCASDEAAPGASRAPATAGEPTAPASVPASSPAGSDPAPEPEPSPTSSIDGGAPGGDGNAAGSGWTGESAYEACVEFFRAKQQSDGYDPDATVWKSYSPESVRVADSAWVVDLSGDFTHDGAEYQTYFSCTVAGTPAAPNISELTA